MRSDAAAGFEAYARPVYAWAYRVLGRHHDALDVVQDVFLRWHAQCARARPEKPRGWLREVTVNRAIDLHRRRRGDALANREKMDAVDPGTAPGVAWPREDEHLQAAIAAALGELSDMQRAVLAAKVYDERTFAQIAADLGTSVPTVKTHYLRAVRALRDRLAAFDEGASP